MSFANIDENVLYKDVPPDRSVHLAFYIKIYYDPLSVVVSRVENGLRNEILTKALNDTR